MLLAAVTLASVASSDVSAQTRFFEPSDPNVRYEGRYDFEDPAAPSTIWAGNQVVTGFTGTSIAVRLRENFGANGRYFAFINEDFSNPILISVGDAVAGQPRFNGTADYTIATGLAPGQHTLRLARLSDYYTSQTEFRGFLVDADATLAAPPTRRPRRIEVWGDSITEGTFQQTPPPAHGWASYAAKTARLLDAEYTPVSRSGMGLFRGYQLPTTLKTLHRNTTSGDRAPVWDFEHNRFDQPHVLVINIGQNDFWTALSTPSNELQGHYLEMLQLARAAHPDAQIVIANGGMSMGSFTNNEANRWRAAIDAAVNQFTAQTGDTRVSRHNFGEVAPDGHPQDAQSTQMAQTLVTHINSLGPGVWNNVPSIPRLEGESFTPAGVSTTIERNPGDHGAASLRVNATAIGQGVNITFPAPPPGEYEVRIWLKRDRDHGLLDVSLNGVLLADDLSVYRPTDSRTIAWHALVSTTLSVTAASIQTLTLTSAGRDPATSSSFAFAIDSIEFRPIPEPASLGLITAGLASLCLHRRRRQA